jgi:signal peptidase
MNIFSGIIQRIIQKMPVRIFAITGSSMCPYLNPGDLILVKKTTEVHCNDVVVFRHPSTGIIAHRIIAIIDQGYYSKGDNNPVRDPGILHKKQVIGKMCYRLAWFGKPRILVNKFRA